jgi:hypothetical protein
MKIYPPEFPIVRTQQSSSPISQWILSQ